MKKYKVNFCPVFVVIGLLLLAGNVLGSSSDFIQVVKISPQDKRAIIKMADGQMQIIRPGDEIGVGSKVVEITAGRIVLEENAGSVSETVIIRLEDRTQQVERIKKASPKKSYIYAIKTPEGQKEWTGPSRPKVEKSKSR